VSDRDRAARITEIFQPYHAQIESELDRRQRGGRPTALIALHSFTPVFEGLRRPWHAAVLYNRDGRLARQLLMLLEENKTLVVADNKPYVISNTTDHTIPIHGERRGLPHVLVEIRQDLIEDEVGRREWALRLADLLPKANAWPTALKSFQPRGMSRRCRLWVKSRHFAEPPRCPLFTQKRTFASAIRISALCHNGRRGELFKTSLTLAYQSG
jgi:predicted N-formylglutamate amidohydrolase